MTRRHSRGTPAMLSVKEQELLVRAADADPLYRTALETMIGRPWESLTFGQRLTAVSQELEKGRAATLVTATLRARIDMQAAVDLVTDEVTKDEVIERQANELEVTQTALSAAEQRIADLTESAASLPPRSAS